MESCLFGGLELTQLTMMIWRGNVDRKKGGRCVTLNLGMPSATMQEVDGRQTSVKRHKAYIKTFCQACYR
jgi:hypothetical protein